MAEPLLIDVPERIATARLLLRCPRPGDGARLNAAVAESLSALRPWMPWAQSAPTLQDSELQCRRMHARFAAREDLVFFVFERDGDGGEGAFVGGSGLHRIDWSVPRFEIGYWRRTGCEGRGLITEAVVALSRMAFDTLGACRVEIRMDARNERSVRVAERAGFGLEGVLRRDSVDVAGHARDTRVHARVRGVEEP
jgi:RimJ/RimL family protein N-acetyltransferase